MRKNLLALTAALLGFTAAQAEPVTLTYTESAEVFANSTLTNNNGVLTFNINGKEAVKITGNFDTYGDTQMRIAPGSNSAAWVDYTIEGTDNYAIISYKLVVGPARGSDYVDNINIQLSDGTTESTSATHDVTIEGTGDGSFKATTSVNNQAKKGTINSVEFVLAEMPEGDVIKFTSADALVDDHGTLSGQSYVTNTTPAAKLSGYFANESNVLCICPRNSGSDKTTYTISADDPENYSVAYFKFVFVRHGTDDITIYYNGRTESTSATNKVTIEGYADQNDPMTFEAETPVHDNWKKCEIESAVIILVPRMEDGKDKTVTFDNTDANSKGVLSNNVYTTNNVPRITLSGNDLAWMNDTKLTIAPAPSAREKSDEQIADWAEYTLKPYNSEKFRLKSCEVNITGYGNDVLKIYYNGEIYSTEGHKTVTIAYPVDAPATMADEATASDPVITFKATTVGDNGQKKGEIVSATFVLEAKDNVTTGMETITGVMNSEGEVIWYDLNGRRVENPTNGIFVNSKGKKHIFAN